MVLSATNTETLTPYLTPILNELEHFFNHFPLANEHQIIKHLQLKKVSPFHYLSLSDTNDLFSAHFLCMHALYLLQRQYEQAASYTLMIESTRIERIELTIDAAKNNQLNLSTPNELASYYLNAKHYFETKESEINELLTSFWQGYFAQNNRQAALQTLQLPLNADQKMIKKKYLQLAQQYHPDKGGCAEKFIAIKEAKIILDQLT